MPHDPYGQGDHWRDRNDRYRSEERWRRERAEFWGDEDRSFRDRDRYGARQPEYMSRREAEDFSRRIGEGEWGWGAKGHDREHRYDHHHHERHDRHGRRDRGLVEEVKDAFQSMFGPRDRYGRDRMDRHEGHRGRGPRGYARSDARIEEDVCERLTEDPYIDASDIEVRVRDREVTLAGTVGTREDKRRAERLVEEIGGVEQVQNNLRIDEHRHVGRAYGSARGTTHMVSGAGADQEAAAFLSGARDRTYR
jgi:osmotically-inducible protein OsmY